MLGTRHVGGGIVSKTQNNINKHTLNNTIQTLGHTPKRTHKGVWNSWLGISGQTEGI